MAKFPETDDEMYASIDRAASKPCINCGDTRRSIPKRSTPKWIKGHAGEIHCENIAACNRRIAAKAKHI